MEFSSSGAPMTAADLDRATTMLRCEPAALWALLAVETSGAGFLPDRRPKLLFERHYFSRLTEGRFDTLDPDISAATPGGYGPAGAHQYDRLQAALLLDRPAALESASWGIGQITGAAFKTAGYSDVETLVADCVGGEGAQLVCLARFLVSTGLATALRDRNWTQLARGYNGPDYAANHYDSRLASSHQTFVDAGPPDLDVRAAQLGLSYRAWPVMVDGRLGPSTRAALADYQAREGLPVTRTADAATLARLFEVEPGRASPALRATP